MRRLRRPLWRLVELEERIVPTYFGNTLFPGDNPWNQVIVNAPVASNSNAIIQHIIDRIAPGNNPRLHPDFGDPVVNNALYGIPVNVVSAGQPLVPLPIAPDGYADESDLGPFPIPTGAILEGDGPFGPAPPNQRGDSHLLVYDKTANIVYESFQTARPDETEFSYGDPHVVGQWGSYQTSVWDLNSNSFRTLNYTSADAAGLPILPGLVRPDEALPPALGGQGVIRHAIRMTVNDSRREFIYPASHFAASSTANDRPRMGERFRLKASFVIPTNWAPEAKAIAQAMKDYGMIVADNGSDMFFSGIPSTDWDDDNLSALKNMRASDFEVVDLTPRVFGLNVTTGTVNGGTTVVITGQNFSGAAGRLQVLFGSALAASFSIDSDSQITVLTPAHSAGTIDVRVQSGQTELDSNSQPVFFGYGTSAIVPAGQFTFGTSVPPTAAPTTIVAADASTSSPTVNLSASVSSGVGVVNAGIVTFTIPGVGAAVTGTVVNGVATAVFTLNAGIPAGTYTITASYSGSPAFLSSTDTATLTVSALPPPPVPGTLALSAATYTTQESAGNLLVTVTRTGGTAGTITVEYATSNDSATAGNDFMATTGTLTFLDGVTLQTFLVPILSDAVTEGDESFTLTLSNPLGGTSLASPFNAIVTIDDVPVMPPPPPPNPPAPPSLPAPPAPPVPPSPPAPPTVPVRAGLAITAVGGTVRQFKFDDSGMANDDGTAAPFAGFTGAVRSAVADVNGDGVPDWIYATGPGGGALVRIVSGVDGTDLVANFDAYAGENFTTIGLFVGAADLDGDGKAEVAVAPDQGGGARVQVFSFRAGGLTQVANFFAIDDPAFRGGGRIALGDFNADGKADMIAGAGFGGGPRIALFDGRDLVGNVQNPRKLVGDFLIFEPGLRDGVFVSAGDLDGDGHADLIFGGGPGGGPRVQVLRFAQVLADVTAAKNDSLANFFAFDSNQRGGVRVSAKDVDGDSKLDLIVGSGDNAPPGVNVYKATALSASSQTPSQSLNPFSEPTLANGVFVG